MNTKENIKREQKLKNNKNYKRFFLQYLKLKE